MPRAIGGVLGAAVVGLLPLAGIPAPEGWLILVPLLYLVHFFYAISSDRTQKGIQGDEGSRTGLPFTARLYANAVMVLSLVLVCYGALHWTPQDLGRFLGYLAMALLAAMSKVRLPGLTSTISISSVIFLVAILELSYAIFIARAATVVQTLWKAKRTPQVIQIAFNSACMILSVSVAYLVCRVLLESWANSVPARVTVATLLLYGSNTLMVAAIVCLAERKSVRRIWQQCYFWSLPYYLVGA